MRKAVSRKLFLPFFCVALALTMTPAIAFGEDASGVNAEKDFASGAQPSIIEAPEDLPIDIDSYGSGDEGIMPLDYSDRYFKLDLHSSTTWATDGRKKDTTASVYANVQQMNTFAYLYADGATSQYGSYLNYTIGGQAALHHCGKFQILNSIRETLGSSAWARIGAWRSTGSAFAITGYWSPDYYNDGSASVLGTS